MSFEEALAAQTDQLKREEMAKLFEKMKKEMGGDNDQSDYVINLDGDSLWQDWNGYSTEVSLIGPTSIIICRQK